MPVAFAISKQPRAVEYVRRGPKGPATFGLIELTSDSDPAWGEASDYLAAVLWRAVTAEGVRLAVAIADKVWPAGG